jgi:hypothetical protein
MCAPEASPSLDKIRIRTDGRFVFWKVGGVGRFPGRAGRPGGGPMTAACVVVEVASSGK